MPNESSCATDRPSPAVETQTIQEFFDSGEGSFSTTQVLKDPHGFGNHQYVVSILDDSIRVGRLEAGQKIINPSLIKLEQEYLMTLSQLNNLGIEIPPWSLFEDPREEIYKDSFSISDNGSYLAYIRKVSGQHFIRLFMFDSKIDLRDEGRNVKILASGSYIDLVLNKC